MAKLSSGKKRTYILISIAVFIMIVYIMIDQIWLASQKQAICLVVSNYINDVEELNNYSEISNIIDKSSLEESLQQKYKDAGEIYTKFFYTACDDPMDSQQTYNALRQNYENITSMKSIVYGFQFEQIAVNRLMKFPFINYVTVNLSYHMNYKLQGEMNYHDGMNLFSVNTNNEIYSSSNSIMITIIMCIENGSWKIKKIDGISYNSEAN